jgi:ribulose-5-phosphate 4-epimerase/fuculose-1-phosphate aldolase
VRQVVLLADNTLLQVHTHGIRHIKPGRPVMEWQTPGRRLIEKATANERQVNNAALARALAEALALALALALASRKR